MTRRQFTAAAAVAAVQPAVRSSLGFSPDCFVIARPPRTPLEYLKKAQETGAGGVQATFDPKTTTPEYLKQIRAFLDQSGMWLEITTRLPEEDTAQFENVIRWAKECGAYCLRSVCLSGRRYETFSDLETWKKFVADSRAKLARTVPILDKHRFPLGLENHKDWTIEEMVPLLKGYSSQYFGACIDFGNNMALLDDPNELVDALAPFVINTHIKDMAVEESEDGFLLSEVALGRGMVDLKRAVATLNKARPGVKYSLDMLTRDPLRIPCLADKYWITFTERNGKHLARMLASVRKNKQARPLVRVSTLSREEQVRVELDNLTASVLYARDELGLRLG